MPPRRRASSTAPSSVAASGEVRIVWMSSPCGWCITELCGKCMPELLFERKLYMCGCKSVKCSGKHVPSHGIESEPKEPVVETETETEEDENDGTGTDD